jgi:two-component system NtrC family sensor kinase
VIEASMTEPSPRLRNITGRRLLGAFAAVLLLFAAALAVELFTLRRIAEAEAEVARLDHAKHAGHMAAAQVREQYIHQAHTLIEFGEGHLGHYAKAVETARQTIAHLESVAEAPADKALARQIGELAEQNDRDFRERVVPAIRGGDRSHVAELGDQLESVVDRVVELNARLNDELERRSNAARARAQDLRGQARIAAIACFALAILVAAGLGLWLTRTIVRRVDSLRQGARRIGSGDLDARIELAGNDEFAELAASFNQMAASLAREQVALVRSQKLASIGQVAAGVAHELNNPLSVILGYTKLLRAAPGPHADDLAIIDSEARQCQRIVAELLDLARPHRLDVQPVDLATLAREAVGRLEDAGVLHDRKVEVVAHDLVVVPADAGRMRQVIANIVVNAAEATAPTGKITIDARAEAGAAILTIADDGPGIPPDTLAQVFDPFVTTKPHGTGLGLAIAHAIVDAHGGRISIASSAETGTCVSLQLPMSPPAEVPAP